MDSSDMNESSVREAMKAAEVFVRRARAVLAQAKFVKSEDKTFFFTGTKTTGALKRASMELTRLLAAMRKSG